MTVQNVGDRTSEEEEEERERESLYFCVGCRVLCVSHLEHLVVCQSRKK